jgi:hypothetical protein
LASLYTMLTFRDELAVVRSKRRLTALYDRGWFPFVELLGGDFEEIARVCRRRRGADRRVATFLTRFDKARIEGMASGWWSVREFADKRPILEAGIRAYLAGVDGDPGGFVHTIKTLSSEIEGVLRLRYRGDGRRMSYRNLLQAFEADVTARVGPAFSLYFVPQLFEYLRTSFLQDFDLGTGRVPPSRHAVNHGVLAPAGYSRERAVQLLLLLDQVRFGLSVSA